MSKSGGAASSKQVSTHSNDPVRRRRMNMQMVQNVLLIWLDNNINDNNANCRNTINQLRRAVNTISTFTDGEECIEFVKTINNEKVCMIISGSLGQHVVPQVHNMSQVDSIFIFCGNKKYHEQWAKDWFKIKGVFTEMSSIYEALKKAAQQCEQDAISISFIATNENISQKKLDQLEPTFMYTQILKDILLTIKFEQQHFMEFIEYCRNVFADNEGELKNVNKLQKQYRDETPIWWYTFKCFLHPMLIRSLRLMDVDIIIKMGFFIADLHRQIVQLHKEQLDGHKSNKRFKVYRGQGMPKTDFEQMTKTKGGLISFNNFLSTSKNRNVSLDFARLAVPNPNIVGILFVMVIDPSQSTTPFASIHDVGYFKDQEDEVLFAMHTVFRISDITPMDENHRLFRVELTLTNDNDPDLRTLTDRIREEICDHPNGWYQLGLFLLKIGQFDKAQQVYETILEQTPDKREKGNLYRQIGSIKVDQGEYEEAIGFYEKSVKICEETLLPNHPDLASSYTNIGLVYDKIGEYSKALLSHEKALRIYQKIRPSNHPDLASTYNNIGLVYNNIGEYSKALSSHEKALKIKQQSLPPNHPDLGGSYNNIGEVYRQMGEYSKALSSYEKALEISKQSLPPNHPDLATSYNNIGEVYRQMGEYSKALSSYEKALEISKQSLPPNHPDLGGSYNNIGEVYRQMGEYSKALSSYEKALEISKQSLPPNHPDLATSYNNIGEVYRQMGEYSKALSSYEKAFEISKQSLPPNHPDLGGSHNKIGEVYRQMGEYSKALSSYEKALEISKQSLPPNHPDLGGSYNNIGLVYEKMGNYSKARSFYERAVDIGQRSLSSNHPNLQKWRNNLDRVKKRL